MIAKLKEKKYAIQLRKRGYSYSEIRKRIPVAKSTVSLWLRSVGLAKRQRQRLTRKRKKAQLKAIQVIRQRRINRTKEIINAAVGDIGKLSKREIFLIGVILYWTEGTKQKSHNVSQISSFGNSDPEMIKIYQKWLKLCGIPESQIKYGLYIHRDYQNRINKFIKFWSSVINSKKIKVYYKRHKPKTNRKIKNYHGLLRIDIAKSTDFNRKIAGWIKGVCKYCGVV